MDEKEFKPYVPADKVTPEFTVTSIVMGIILDLAKKQSHYITELCSTLKLWLAMVLLNIWVNDFSF